MFGEATVCSYVSVESWCFEMSRIRACSSGGVRRRLTDVNFLCFLYVPEILILGYDFFDV
jgi:hypothetical protein